MCIADIPNIIYYAYLPALLMSLLFSIFIYLQNRKNTLNKLLAAITLTFSLYLVIDFITWFPMSLVLYTIFSKIVVLIMIMFPLFIYFGYYLVEIKISNNFKHFVIWFTLLPLIIIVFSKYYNLVLIITNEGSNCVVKEGKFFWYLYFLAATYLVWFISILLINLKNKKIIVKKRIKLVVSAVSFLIIWVFTIIWLENIFGETIFLFLPFGVVIFIGILAYAITKYEFLNIKLLTAQVLTAATWILIASQFFFIKTPINFVLTGFTLVLAIIFGIMLVKSVKIEVKRKEELQMMSDKLSQANDQLRKLDNAKSEFISIASHQLRTPLTSIKGYTSLIMEGTYGKILPKVHDALNKIYLSNERLIDLVENLLSISRIESGRMEYKYQECQLEDTLKELMDTFAITARSRKLTLELKLPEKPLPKITMDPGKIREVVSNIIDNAIKYTKRGGVTIRADADANYRLPALQGSGERVEAIRITVSDTGIGVPKEELPYIFSKFSRGKDTSRLHVGGTGLGLYVGRSMIEAHKGKIWAESEGQDKGSRFIVELPVMQEG